MKRKIIQIFEIKELIEIRTELPSDEDKMMEKLEELIKSKNGQKIHDIKYYVKVVDYNGDGQPFCFDENLEEIDDRIDFPYVPSY